MTQKRQFAFQSALKLGSCLIARKLRLRAEDVQVEMLDANAF